MRSPRRIVLPVTLLLVACAALVLSACSPPASPSGGASSAAGSTAPDQASGGNGSGSAQPAGASGETSTPGLPPLHTAKIKAKGDEVAVITTSRGVIRFKFFPKDAPNTVASYIELADAKFYDGTTFHRVEPGFVIQGGDPLSKSMAAGSPQLGTGDPGYRLQPEFNKRKHLTGSVAMARAELPDSAGSQFYICLAPQPSLDGQYTVFGQVISGMDVVKRTQVGDKMISVRIEHSPAGR